MGGTFAGVYCGPAPLPSGLWAAWNLDPVLIAGLVALAYAVRQSGAGLAAVAVLTLAFVSPLCALSAALFSARVAHHVLLVAVAAPLLAMVRPGGRGGAGAPFLAATAALWLWHLPGAYDAALSNTAIYWAMQGTLLGTATLFWRAVLRPDAPTIAGVVWTVAAFMAMGFLGALLTFAPTPLYAAHAIAPFDWGLTPLADQRLGGLIMWVPAGLPYLVIIIVSGRRLWAPSERTA
jgi:putative membrane protein